MVFASVLGVFKLTDITGADNLDSLDSGFYNYRVYSQDPTNSPYPGQVFSLICIAFINDRILQIAVRNNEIKERTKWGSTWNSWKTISTT